MLEVQVEMSRLSDMIATLALLSTAVFGTAEACTAQAQGTAALVSVHGFKDRDGNLRIAVYPAKEEDFLVGGRYTQRIDTPMTEAGSMTVCAPVKKPGKYIVVALHDRNADGKMNPFSDGVGMSRNPQLGLSKPKISLVEVQLNGVTPMNIRLNYLQGLQPRPWQGDKIQ